jgi:hypothetical protein
VLATVAGVLLGVAGYVVLRWAGVGSGSGLSGCAHQAWFDAFPARIGAGHAPELPSDRPVGRAAFLYTADLGSGGEPVVLVTTDGAGYRLGPSTVDGTGTVSLSPDGCRLAFLRGGGWVVRDLASTTEYVVDAEGPATWSGDGRFLLWRTAGRPGSDYKIMDTADGRLTDAEFDDSLMPLALLGRSQLAAFNLSASVDDPPTLVVDIVDLATGDTVRSVPVELSPHLRQDEYLVAYFVPYMYAIGDPPRLWVSVGVLPESTVPEAQPALPTGVVGADLLSGRVLARHTWPEPGPEGYTAVAGAVTGGALIARMTGTVTEVSLATETGARRVLTRLPADSMIHGSGFPSF